MRPSPPNFSISRCANLQRMKRRWKRKQKLEANDTETKLIIKEGGGKKSFLTSAGNQQKP